MRLGLSVMSSRFLKLSTHYNSNSPQQPGIPGRSDSYDPAKMILGAYPEDRHSKGILYFIVLTLLNFCIIQRPTLLSTSK